MKSPPQFTSKSKQSDNSSQSMHEHTMQQVYSMRTSQQNKSAIHQGVDADGSCGRSSARSTSTVGIITTARVNHNGHHDDKSSVCSTASTQHPQPEKSRTMRNVAAQFVTQIVGPCCQLKLNKMWTKVSFKETNYQWCTIAQSVYCQQGWHGTSFQVLDSLLKLDVHNSNCNLSITISTSLSLFHGQALFLVSLFGVATVAGGGVSCGINADGGKTARIGTCQKTRLLQQHHASVLRLSDSGFMHLSVFLWQQCRDRQTG